VPHGVARPMQAVPCSHHHSGGEPVLGKMCETEMMSRTRASVLDPRHEPLGARRVQRKRGFGLQGCQAGGGAR
jgi:hypothetical protein